MFADPITMVLMPTGQVLRCNDLAPARYLILNQWYCNMRGELRKCNPPQVFPLTPLEIKEVEGMTGLGKSIYSEEQMRQFHLFQHSSGTR